MQKTVKTDSSCLHEESVFGGFYRAKPVSETERSRARTAGENPAGPTDGGYHESENKADYYFQCGDRGSPFFDYDCIYRIYEYAARRGGYASDEGVPGGDASFGAFDYGNDQRVSDRLDIPQHFKSYRDHEESHPEYS